MFFTEVKTIPLLAFYNKKHVPIIQLWLDQCAHVRGEYLVRRYCAIARSHGLCIDGLDRVLVVGEKINLKYAPLKKNSCPFFGYSSSLGAFLCIIFEVVPLLSSF